MKYWERTFTVTLKDDGVSQWKDRKGKNASGSHSMPLLRIFLVECLQNYCSVH